MEDRLAIVALQRRHHKNRKNVASTSLTLGEHWEQFIQSKIATGRYSTVSEVVREALRFMEEREMKLNALRAHLAEGTDQAVKGRFDEGYSLDGLISELDG